MATVQEQEPHVQLVALDVDGTLLAPNDTIRPRVAEAVQATVRAGCVVALATSRRFDAAQTLASKLGVRSPLILQDGAVIQDSGSGSVFCEELLSEYAQAAVVRLALELGVQPLLMEGASRGGGIYAGPPEFDHANLAKYRHVRGPFLRREAHALASATRATSVMFLAPEPELDRVSCALAPLPGLQARRSYQHFYETPTLTVMASGVCKGRALSALAQLMDIPMTRVMAIGDGDEDQEMLAVAGYGIAMGNASPAASRAAAYRTLSNAEDGVAIALERTVLIQNM